MYFNGHSRSFSGFKRSFVILINKNKEQTTIGLLLNAQPTCRSVFSPNTVITEVTSFLEGRSLSSILSLFSVKTFKEDSIRKIEREVKTNHCFSSIVVVHVDNQFGFLTISYCNVVNFQNV